VEFHESTTVGQTKPLAPHNAGLIDNTTQNGAEESAARTSIFIRDAAR